MIGLTSKQALLLNFIRKFSDEHGFPPSFGQMKEEMGLASKSGVARLIEALEERGHIRRMKHRARAIEIIDRTGLANIPTLDLRRELARRQEGVRI